MTDILKIVITAISTGVVLILVKIIWDFLSNRNKSDCNDCTVKADVIKIKVEIENLTSKIDKLSSVIVGNGDMGKSMVYRLAAIEEFIKDVRSIKESRAL